MGYDIIIRHPGALFWERASDEQALEARVLIRSQELGERSGRMNGHRLGSGVLASGAEFAVLLLSPRTIPAPRP